MTALFASLNDKQRMLHCIRHIVDIFFWDKVSPVQQVALRRHCEAMEAFGGTYEVHSEIARGKDMKSMKIIITVNPEKVNG